MQPNVSLKRHATFAVFALGVVAATSILGQMFFIVARPQCRVVVDVFLGSQSVAWPDKYRSAVCCNSSNRRQFCSSRQLGGNLFAPTSWMGSIRGDTQYRDLAIKQLTDLTIRSPSESPLAQSGQ